MSEKNKKYQIMNWSLSRKVWWVFIAVLLIIFGCIYVGLLIVPDWELFIRLPILHQGVAYLTIFGIITLLIFILYLVVNLVFSNQRLEDKNKDLEKENEEFNKRVKELETELIRLKKDE